MNCENEQTADKLIDTLLDCSQLTMNPLQQLITSNKFNKADFAFFELRDNEVVFSINKYIYANDLSLAYGVASFAFELNESEMLPNDLLEAYTKDQISIQHLPSKFLNRFLQIDCYLKNCGYGISVRCELENQAGQLMLMRNKCKYKLIHACCKVCRQSIE
jgi:hypothetical protein